MLKKDIFKMKKEDIIARLVKEGVEVQAGVKYEALANKLFSVLQEKALNDVATDEGEASDETAGAPAVNAPVPETADQQMIAALRERLLDLQGFVDKLVVETHKLVKRVTVLEKQVAGRNTAADAADVKPSLHGSISSLKHK